MKNIKLVYLIITFFVSSSLLWGKVFTLNYTDGDKYSLTIRGNFRIYENKRYRGLRNVELKALCTVAAKAGYYQIEGKQFYLNKKILNGRAAGYRIDEILPLNISFDSSGISPVKYHSFPLLQGVPFFPIESIIETDQYEGEGFSTVELFKAKTKEVVPVVIQVRYGGRKEYNGKLYDYFDITYRFRNDYSSDNIKRVGGFHTLKLYFDGDRGRPVFMTDRFEEHIVRQDSVVEKRVGFYSFFYQDVVKMDKKKVSSELNRRIKLKNSDISLRERDNELSLILNNLKFKANSAELLPGEYTKLEELSEALKSIENRTFMIVGHTADVGNPSSQLELSIKRAESIAAYLISRGIDAKRVLYTGKGASEPVASNDSEVNRSRNRRVEILILED